MPPARKIKQYGLTEVYASPEKPAQVDVVLVHGLNGHPKDTWTSKTGDVFWPVDVLPEFLGNSSLRILTYGYNANVTSFTDGASKDRIHHHAETLASELYANRSLRACLERPIIFVCHSLGGLVVKRCMIACRNYENDKLRHLRSIYISTFGILFLGTPHTGSDVAKWGLLLQKICSAVFPKKFMDSSPQLIEALKSNNEVLQNINRLFNESFSRFHIYFFHETKPLDLKGTREFIVDESSAAPDIEGAERMGIEADHSSMVKFEDDSSPGFEAVAEAIIRYSREAPPVVAGWWKEERAHVQLHTRSRVDELTRSTADVSQEVALSESETRMGNSVLNLSLPPISSAAQTPRMAQSVELLPPHRGPLFVVPPGFHPNAIFIGMEKELKELHIRLFNVKRREERAAAVLVCGGPGSGKTYLAREYVHRHRKDFPGGIFWIDAKTIFSTSTCYWDVAQAAALTDDENSKYPTSTDEGIFVEQVRHWFESREEWLIVFDGINFDEDSKLNEFKKYLPFRKNTSIIYTTVDRTLAKKQRLFEPYRLNVRPLKVEEARQLLLYDLDIDKPTEEQWKKATEIAHYYQGLPLAIHATAHRLAATRKPLERYHLNSHLTDQRLAEPFLGIMEDLRVHHHPEAENLINVLAFFGHHVPVGMISWGRSALEGQISILTSSRPGEPGDLDTTLGVLIQYGLIERISDRYPGKLLSIHDDDVKIESPESEISGAESFSESMTTSGIYQNAIDVVKLHSVVQTFIRDELRIRDGKSKQQVMKMSSADGAIFQQQPENKVNSEYLQWLLIASRVYYRSYEVARHKMVKEKAGHQFVKDLREYEAHAERILSYYKKTDGRLAVVKDTKKLVKNAIAYIREEIGKVSPNSSQESFRHGKSIFDRSSSSSSGPSSLEDSLASQRSTFYEDGVITVQSPMELIEQQFPLQFPLANRFRDNLEVVGQNDGYLSDGEVELRLKSRRSSATSKYSHTTERTALAGQGAAVDGSALGTSPDESGWETVQRKRKGGRNQVESGSGSRRTSQGGRDSPKSKPRFRGRLRDLGSFRPSPVTKVSSAQGEGSISIVGISDRRNPTPTNAKELLASLQKPSARRQTEDEDSKGTSSPWITSPVLSPPPTEPLSTTSVNAPSQSAPSVLSSKSRQKSIMEEGTSDLPAVTELERYRRLSPMSYSDPSLVATNPFRETSSVQDSTRRPSRSSQTSALNPAYPSFIPRHSLQEFGTEDPRYIPGLESNMISLRWRHIPETGPVPGFSTSPSHQQNMPGGYTSEPLSAAMSRDPSNQSRASWQTDPAPVSQQATAQLLPSQAIPSHLSSSPTYTVVYAPENSSINQTAAYALPVAGPAPTAVNYMGLATRLDYGGEPDMTAGPPNQSIFFGTHEVDIGEARRRAFELQLRRQRQRQQQQQQQQPPPAILYDPRTGQPFLTSQAQAPPMQAQRSDPGVASVMPIPMPVTLAVPMQAPLTTTTDLNGRSRSRSGSSPDVPHTGVPPLGLGITNTRYSSPRNR